MLCIKVLLTIIRTSNDTPKFILPLRFHVDSKVPTPKKIQGRGILVLHKSLLYNHKNGNPTEKKKQKSFLFFINIKGILV